MKLEQIIKLKLNNFKIEVPKKLEIEPNPCENGYEPIGLKEKDGMTVPNCVPIKKEQSKQDFVIPSPEGGESESDYMGRCISQISDEYPHDQSVAICISKWQEQ